MYNFFLYNCISSSSTLAFCAHTFEIFLPAFSLDWTFSAQTSRYCDGRGGKPSCRISQWLKLATLKSSSSTGNNTIHILNSTNLSSWLSKQFSLYFYPSRKKSFWASTYGMIWYHLWVTFRYWGFLLRFCSKVAKDVYYVKIGSIGPQLCICKKKLCKTKIWNFIKSIKIWA